MRLHPFLTATALVLQSDISLAIPSPASGALSALRALDYRYFVAGGTCAALSHGITTPIDVVKTKIQSEPEKYGKGMQQAALTIIKTEGAGVLLAGLGPTVVGYGIEGAMKVRLWVSACRTLPYF
jgi:solute carrier family 25 phosphate transporter 3